MPTFLFQISYEGTAYCGWQVQPNGPSIQQTIEDALDRVTQQRVRITGSGRTDAGVHAIRQFANCQLNTALSTNVLQNALNGNLPADIRITDVQIVPDTFHAIRDAVQKTYRYQIVDAKIHDIFFRHYAWHVHQPLDCNAMRTASQQLVGTHDFASFQSAGSERKSTTRTVFRLNVERDESNRQLILIEVTANGFLYNMVRNIVGTLVEIGKQRQSVQWMMEVLSAMDRRAAGPTAPAHGLFLVDVVYPPFCQRSFSGPDVEVE